MHHCVHTNTRVETQFICVYLQYVHACAESLRVAIRSINNAATDLDGANNMMDEIVKAIQVTRSTACE
jgi:hypothetical protein